MSSVLKRKYIHYLTYFFSIAIAKIGYCAIAQNLNDTFFQNPAELKSINKAQVTAGNVFISPFFNYSGAAFGANGSVNSTVVDYLPYVLSAYRVTDKLVLGLNALPSMYGHLDWPVDSFVAPAATLTKLLYYRFGVQSSYQVSENLALGIGFNVEDNGQYQLNFITPGQGNQINRISGINYTGDFGLYYKINAKNYLTIAGYTQVDTYGHGSSSIGLRTNNNLSMNITQAPVIYIGLEHFANEKWFIEGKVYWSGWSIQKNINFTNTIIDTHIVPTDWKDVWSFQVTSRYAMTERWALLTSIIYETNPVPLATNAIGYPLAAAGTLSGGLDITLTRNFSIQGIYNYGAFLPNSPIYNAVAVGTINAHFQAGVLQFIYKK